eukprot:6454982-Amphidinium_carterae.2
MPLQGQQHPAPGHGNAIGQDMINATATNPGRATWGRRHDLHRITEQTTLKCSQGHWILGKHRIEVTCTDHWSVTTTYDKVTEAPPEFIKGIPIGLPSNARTLTSDIHVNTNHNCNKMPLLVGDPSWEDTTSLNTFGELRTLNLPYPKWLLHGNRDPRMLPTSMDGPVALFLKDS